MYNNSDKFNSFPMLRILGGKLYDNFSQLPLENYVMPQTCQYILGKWMENNIPNRPKSEAHQSMQGHSP